MTDRVSAPAGSDVPVNGSAEPRSRAGFLALTLGSIGVVYGDIGTSPLYALREAVSAATDGQHGAIDRGTVLGVVSLILWALLIVVTLKYVVILLRADNNGEGGTLTLMALASRAVNRIGRAAVIVTLLGIISAALFYGDAVITPALSVLSAVEGIDVATPALHDYVVRFHRAAGHWMDCVRSGHSVGAQSAAWPVLPRPSRHDRALYARCSVSRRHRCGSALCRSRSFRTRPDPVRLAWTGAALAGGELLGSGRSGFRAAQGARKSVLSPLSRLGAHSDGGPGDGGDRNREPSRHHRRLFADQPGDPARTFAAVRDSPHLGATGRPDFYAARQQALADWRAASGRSVPLVERAGLSLWHSRNRYHGRHRHDGLHRHLAHVALVAGCSGGADRAVPSDRPHLPVGEHAQSRTGRLGAACARRAGDAGDVYVAARHAHSVRQDAPA